MRSPDRFRIARALVLHEVRGLLASRALWSMLLALAPLVGYGFIQAVRLFSEASRSALEFPELARSMSPLDGILVPTFGSFYLAVTLLFPFVAIRAVAEEKQSGAAKLAVQFPVTIVGQVAAKFLAVGAAWLIALFAPLSAVAAWRLLGGHVYGPELLNLLLGHALYALMITAIGFFSAALTDSTGTAAIVTLAFAIGSWVLDFAATGQSGVLAEFASLSLSHLLREFEHGLFASPALLEALLLFAALFALAAVGLRPGMTAGRKTRAGAAIVCLGVACFALAAHVRYFVDVSEDRRNSFNPADEAALAQMTAPLNITLYLAPEDSRTRELESNVLAKLRRIVPRLTIRYGEIGKQGLFGAAQDERYGFIAYDYAGKRDESRSSSEREILPILHALAGTTVRPVATKPYPGYPSVVDARLFGWWFYAALPALIGLAWWRHRKIG